MTQTIDGKPVHVFGGDMPLDLAAAIHDPTCRRVAHNAAFEVTQLSDVPGARLGIPCQRDRSLWDCTAAWAARLGLPRTLDGAAAALMLGTRKDKDGHALMLKMCKPRKLRKAEIKAREEYARREAGRPGWTPAPDIVWHETPEQIIREAAYCAHDVAVEIALWRVLPCLSPFERRVWELTERMNDAGVPVDLQLLGAMLGIIEDAESRLDADISEATGGAVPRVTDHMALTRWLVANGIDDDPESDWTAKTGVGKAAIAALLENPDIPAAIRNVLVLRRDGGGTSSKKYRAILARLSRDGRIRGTMVYCGAAATGRWSSRGAQLQNLSRGGQIKDGDDRPIDALPMIRDILAGATAAEIESMYGPALVVAAECLRPLFAEPDNDNAELMEFAA